LIEFLNEKALTDKMTWSFNEIQMSPNYDEAFTGNKSALYALVSDNALAAASTI